MELRLFHFVAWLTRSEQLPAPLLWMPILRLFLCSFVRWKLCFFSWFYRPIRSRTFNKVQLQRSGCPGGWLANAQVPCARPPHCKLHRSFQILTSVCRSELWPQDVSGKARDSWPAAGHFPANIIGIHLEWGATTAHLPSFFSAVCGAECLIDICIKCHKS